LQAKKHMHYFTQVGRSEVANSVTQTKLDEFHQDRTTPGNILAYQKSESLQAISESATSYANST
jgi:hypothetical protein